MSLWAWLAYSYSYTLMAVKMPLSLTFWQHFYSLNVLLIIQETADTFGLVCLGLLFLSAHIFSRNFMFSIFTNFSNKTSTLGFSKHSADSTPNNLKLLSSTASAANHLRPLLNASYKLLYSKIKG